MIFIKQDALNHQYILSILGTNITRYIDYRIASDDYINEIKSEMITEYRQLKLKELLNEI